MATVPSPTRNTVGQQVRDAQITPYQSFNTNEGMFGGVQARNLAQAGQSVMQAGQDFAQVNAEMTQRSDERALLEAENMVNDWKYETFHGENGLYTKKGSATKNATKDIGDQFSQFKGSDAFNNLELSDRGREALEQYFNVERNKIATNTAKYETSEMRAYEDGLLTARIDGAKEDAATNYTDTQALAESESKIRSSVKVKARNNGWSPEETQQYLEGQISSMHETVINRMLVNNQGPQAEEYLEKNKDEIDGADIAAVEKAVNAGAVKDKAREATDSIISLNVSENDALSKARAIEDTEVADETVRRLKIRYSEMAEETRLAEKQAKADAWGVISGGGTPDDLTPTQLNALGREVDSMWTMVNNRAKRGEPYSPTGDVEKFQKYNAMSDDEIVDVDLTPLQSGLTKTQYSTLVKRQEQANKNIQSLQENPNMSTQINRLLKQYAPSELMFGSTSSKVDDDMKAQQNALRDRMNSYVQNYIETNNKAPSEEDMRKEAARITVEVELDAPFWSTMWNKTVTAEELEGVDMTGYDVDAGQLSAASGIPEKHIDGIRAVIEEVGAPLTIDNMRQVYEKNGSPK